jgi:hypothetical protein
MIVGNRLLTFCPLYHWDECLQWQITPLLRQLWVLPRLSRNGSEALLSKALTQKEMERKLARISVFFCLF